MPSEIRGLQLTSDAGVALLGLNAGRSDAPPDSRHPINPPTLQLLQLTRGPPHQGEPGNRKTSASRRPPEARMNLVVAYAARADSSGNPVRLRIASRERPTVDQT